MPLRSGPSDRRSGSPRSAIVRFGATSISLEDAFDAMFVERSDCDIREHRLAFAQHRRDEAESYRKTLDGVRFTAREDARIREYLSTGAPAATSKGALAAPPGTDGGADAADEADEADALIAKCKKGCIFATKNPTEKSAIDVFAAYAGCALCIGFHRYLELVRDAGTVPESFPEQDVLALFLKHSDRSTGLASFPGFVAAVSELAVAGGMPERSGVLSVVALRPSVVP
jgi:hypothetical protein